MNGEIIASELVAQPFISAKYFWPRPSAGEYATMPSGASNLSWTSGKLVRTVAERRAALLKAHNLPEKTPVPADMLLLPAAVWSLSSLRKRRNCS